MDTVEREQLRNHLAGRHGCVMVDSGLAELVEQHRYDHNGPCGIRNHDEADLSYDAARAAATIAEAVGVQGEREARSLSVVTELAAIAIAGGDGGPFHLTVTADPADVDDTDEVRRYYIDADELVVTDAGFVTGVRRARFELHLTRLGPVDDDGNVT